MTVCGPSGAGSARIFGVCLVTAALGACAGVESTEVLSPRIEQRVVDHQAPPPADLPRVTEPGAERLRTPVTLGTDERTMPRGGGVYRVGRPYTIRGQTYVPSEDPNYRNEGVASWYGDGFHGKKTANGEIYDRYALSAAHRTLPIPSYVRVTNLGNRRSIIVRVNDRGPYHENRILDLSERAARMLGFAHLGLARVRVEYVGRAPVDGSDDRVLAATLRTDGSAAPSPSAVRLAAGLPTVPAPANASPVSTPRLPAAVAALDQARTALIRRPPPAEPAQAPATAAQRAPVAASPALAAPAPAPDANPAATPPAAAVLAATPAAPTPSAARTAEPPSVMLVRPAAPETAGATPPTAFAPRPPSSFSGRGLY